MSCSGHPSSGSSENVLHLLVEPPKILPWMSKEEQDGSILLLGLEADHEDKDCIRIDLDVVFNPIPVRRKQGPVRQADFYVGCTGAEIGVEASAGSILKHTGPTTLSVGYSNSTSRNRSSGLTLDPILAMNSGETKLGAVTKEASQEVTFNATFSSEERVLQPVLLHDTIKWTINLPRGNKAVRDFLMGNLHLFAVCRWDHVPRTGRVTVRPSDVRFFDGNREPLGPRRSLMMEFVLWLRRIQVFNKDGFSARFEEKSK